jgi:DNA polymerase-3 subunit delta'
VEQAVDLVHEATLRPVEGRYKVFIIQDAHTANDGFANKLLKTLEEPPDYVVFILTALDRNSVLPTIASRCQVIELRPLPPPVVREALMTQWQAAPAQADLLARLCNGRLGWAVAQLQAGEGMARRQQQLEQLWRLVEADRIARLKMAAELAPDRDDRLLFGMLELWTTWWRDVLLAQAGCMDQCSHIDQQAEIARQASGIAPEAVRAYLHTLHRVEGYLRHTVNTRLALDVLLLQLPRLGTREA